MECCFAIDAGSKRVCVCGGVLLRVAAGKNDHGLLLRDFPMDSTGGASLVVSLRFCPYF